MPEAPDVSPKSTTASAMEELLLIEHPVLLLEGKSCFTEVLLTGSLASVPERSSFTEISCSFANTGPQA